MVSRQTYSRSGWLLALRRQFSWRLALIFMAGGAALATVSHFLRKDFDGRGFVQSPDGLRLAYEVEGRGDPLVLISGGPGISHHGFHPYLGRLRDRATLIYFDPRGRGRSDPAIGYRVSDDVSDLEALRSGLGLERMDLLGVSYGAHLAITYAVEHPERVRKLILVSPIVGSSAWRDHLLVLAAAPGMEETLAGIRKEQGEVRLLNRSGLKRIAETLFPLYWCSQQAGRRAGGVFRPWHWVAVQNFDVYESIVGRPFPELNGDLARSRVEELLTEVQAPTLIVQGKCDRVLPPGHAHHLADALPQARLVVLRSSGHTPFAEEPEAFSRQVAAFLAEPAASPPRSKGGVDNRNQGRDGPL